MDSLQITWSRNELSRLITTPKLHFLDSGLQSTLTRLSPYLLLTQRVRFGATLETWVFGELQKMLSISDQSWFLSHYRDKDQLEVDFVLESPQREVIVAKECGQFRFAVYKTSSGVVHPHAVALHSL